MAEVKIKMTGALVSQTGDITVENISTEETLEKVLRAAETINNTLKTKTTSVNTAQINARFSKLSETTSNLNKSFTSLDNSISDLSKKLGDVGVGQLSDGVEDIKKNLDQTAADIGGFSGSLFDIAGSVHSATQALNLFEVSSEEMSAGASEAGAVVAGMSKKAAGALVAFQLLANVMGGVIRMMGGLMASTVKLISQFVMGENKLSAYTETVAEALSSIPLLGGILGSLVGIVAESIKVVEGYRDVQAQLAESGAAFGQDLMYMRSIAEKTGLGMEGFAGVISKNTEIFAKFGSVSQGAVLFAKTTAILRNKMLNMGYTVEDLNEGLTQAMSLNSAGAAVRGQNEQALSESADRLMIQMDALAKLTGQSRRSQAESIKKQQMTAAYQMAMASMDSLSRDQVNQAMMTMQATMGDLGSEMVKLNVLGVQPFTNEQMMATATMGEAVSNLNTMVNLAKKGQLTQEKLDEKTADVLAAVGKDAQKVKTILKVAAAGLGGSAADISKNFDEVYNRMGQFIDSAGKLDRVKFAQALKEIREEQKKRDIATKSLNKFENSMMKLRSVLIDKVLTPLYNIFAPMLVEFANNFERRLPEFYQVIANFGKDTVGVMKSISEWTLKLTNMSWWETMIDDIGIKFEKMILDIRGSLPRAMGGLYAEEIKAQKQMLQERKGQNSAIREVEAERARARVEGTPVNLTEPQIQAAYQANYAREQAAMLESAGDELRTLADLQKTIGEQEAHLQRREKIRERRPGETDTSLRVRIYAAKAGIEGDEQYKETLAKLNQSKADQTAALKKKLNIPEGTEIKISGDSKEFYKSLQPLVEKKIGTYLDFKKDKMTAPAIAALSGLTEQVNKLGAAAEITAEKAALLDTLNKIKDSPANKTKIGPQQAALEQDPEFKKKIAEVSEKFNLDPQKLIAMMKLESNLETDAVNKKSAATGLIQFMPETARGLGTTVEGLIQMTAVQQMEYVAKYLEGALRKVPKGEKVSSSDLYASVFWPKAVGESEDYIIAKKGEPAYELNFNSLDVDKDGKIQKWELGEKIDQKIKEPSRSSGTLGSTGKLFEDFGKGTKVTAHNLESIMTPDQLREIVTASQERLSSEVVGKIMGSNTEVQNRMVNLLSQIREILGDSHRYHREIANNI